MSALVLDIRRGEFARALVAVAEIHLHTAVLFAADPRRASQFLLSTAAESLTHHSIRETAFSKGLWYLYDYAESVRPPVPMGLDQWMVSQAISSYLQLLESAGRNVFPPEKYRAVKCCMSVCVRANARFTSRPGWLPFMRPMPR